MLLTALPIETFSIITAYLHHLDIYNLCFTGSRVINAKVAKGLTELRIVFNAYFDPFPWPPYPLRSMKLRYLLIHNENRDPKTPLHVPSSLLLVSSNTLREMNLSGFGAHQAFQQSMMLQPCGAYPVLETLTICHTRRMTSRPLWPKSLRRLTLSSFNNCREEMTPFFSLPPNLTTLHANYDSLYAPESDRVLIPQSLTCLELNCSLPMLAYNLIPLLPIGLTAFSCHSYGHRHAYLELTRSSIPLLPPHLTILEWPVRVHHDREMIRGLPKTLTWLEKAIVAPKDFDALPRSLTHFDHQEHEMSLSKTAIPNLPPYLKRVHLSLSALSVFDPEVNVSVLVGKTPSSQKIPRNCTSLSNRVTSLTFPSLSPVPFAVLPKALNSLELYRGSLTTRQVSLLPRSLQELILIAGGIPGDAEAWANLPPTLTRLVMCNVTALSTETSAHIPSTLRLLTLLPSASVTPAWFEGLPDCLESLVFQFVLQLTESSTLRFPPSLLRLSLTMSVELDENVTAKTTSSMIPNIICALPPTLETLTLSVDRIYLPYTISDLSRLPSRLQQLYFPGIPELDLAHVRPVLPKSLLHATIGKSVFKLPDAPLTN